MKKLYKSILGIQYMQDPNTPHVWEFKIRLYDPSRELESFFNRFIKKVQRYQYDLRKQRPYF